MEPFFLWFDCRKFIERRNIQSMKFNLTVFNATTIQCSCSRINSKLPIMYHKLISFCYGNNSNVSIENRKADVKHLKSLELSIAIVSWIYRTNWFALINHLHFPSWFDPHALPLLEYNSKLYNRTKWQFHNI